MTNYCGSVANCPCDCPEQPMDYIWTQDLDAKDISGCSTNDARLFKCTNKVMYHSHTTPSPCCDGEQDINLELGIKRDLNYTKNSDGCWTTCNDGRLTNMAHPTPIGLDAPPYVGSVSNKYSEKLSEYKTGYYKDYASINTGQIRYYNDEKISGPFNSPAFTLSSQTDYFITKDPMGGVNAEFERTPLTCSQAYMGDCSQWIKDSMKQREDIMSKQMYTMNKNNWSAINGYKYNSPGC